MQLKILLPIIGIASFLLTVVFSRIAIPKLRSMKMGQKILDIGPRWHKNKEGTPTMGGVVFLLAAILVAGGVSAYLLLCESASLSALLPFWALILFAVVSGLIGMIDDSVKITKKRNEGLTPLQKSFLQTLSAAAFLLVLRLLGEINTVLYVPFFHWSIDLGVFYYILAMFMIVGMVNSVNLTDGIDGLASGEMLVVSLFLAGMSATQGLVLPGAAAAMGAGLAAGFLVYNFYPARVFMGDTGSLFFGGLLIGCGFLLGNPLLVFVCGIMFVVETASVILQTMYFKITRRLSGTGKRIFKMSPIHHHFEMCGWSEVKIVTVFCLINLIFSAASFLLEYIL